MSKLRDIAEKVIGGIIPLSEDELAVERLKVCKECPHVTRLFTQCDLCGCFLELKVKILSARCPINKW